VCGRRRRYVAAVNHDAAVTRHRHAAPPAAARSPSAHAAPAERSIARFSIAMRVGMARVSVAMLIYRSRLYMLMHAPRCRRRRHALMRALCGRVKQRCASTLCSEKCAHATPLSSFCLIRHGSRPPARLVEKDARCREPPWRVEEQCSSCLSLQR